MLSKAAAYVCDRGVETMKEGARYVKIVEWSEEDQWFVGSCPGLFYGGCHGDAENAMITYIFQINDTILAPF